jgi:uncharacterized iron-regulated membrane protein
MSTSNTVPAEGALSSSRLYRAVWRWHFYAGLFVVPFLLVLAISGLAILFVTGVSPEYGDWTRVSPKGEPLAPSKQVEFAVAAHPGGKVGQYIAPWGKDYAALVRVDLADGNRMLAVNPYDGSILHDRLQGGTWNEFMTNVHGELLIGGNGGVGDTILEAAASLAVIMVVTGLYMWWPRAGRGIVTALLPSFSFKGRALWKNLHETVGGWMSVVLLFFLLSGLAWAAVWGGKMTQAWSTFPAEKWDAVPLSTKTHASLNQGAREDVPWTLAQTLMPQSGSKAGIPGLPDGTPVVLDSVFLLGRAIGFDGRFQIAFPADDAGVWTLSRDSMSYDSTNPTADRTVHIDQFTGRILADVKFTDYPLFGKVMAVAIALHEGQMGWWNVALNALFCLSVIFACLSGIVMWWKRKPAGELGSPKYPRDYRVPAGVLGLGAVLAAAFPIGGLVILLFAIIDFFLPKRLKQAGANP